MAWRRIDAAAAPVLSQRVCAGGAGGRRRQFGTVVESSADFYASRVPKRQRKATIVDELLADDKSRAYFRRRYQEVQDRQAELAKGARKFKKAAKPSKAGKPKRS